MVFADLFFIYFFLPLCLICYFVAKKLETRNKVLIVFSLIFYAWGEPIWIILLLFSAAFNWIMGMHIGANRNKPRGKIFIATAISVDILLLLIFKYTGFFAETFNGIFHASIPVPQIALPIGISFYMFSIVIGRMLSLKDNSVNSYFIYHFSHSLSLVLLFDIVLLSKRFLSVELLQPTSAKVH